MNKKGHMPMTNSKGKTVFVDIPISLYLAMVIIVIGTFLFVDLNLPFYICLIPLIVGIIIITIATKRMNAEAEEEIGITILGK